MLALCLSVCLNAYMKIFKKRSHFSKKSDRQLVRTMRLLGDENRFKIFKLLILEDMMCVSDIAEELGVSSPAVSQHFKNFELLDLVIKERQGSKICYSLKSTDPLVHWLALHLQKDMKV